MADTTKKMEIVFKSSMVNFRKVAFPIFLMVIGFVSESVYWVIKQPYNPERLYEVYFRVGVSIVLLGVTGYIYRANHGRTLKFSGNALTVLQGESKVVIPYNALRILGPKPGKTSNRSIIITDGQSTFKCEEFFFRQFDDLLMELTSRRAQTHDIEV